MIPIYHRFGWLVLKPYALLVSRLYGVRCTFHQSLPSGPFLLLANHGGYIDPYLLAAHTPPLSFVVNEEAFTSPMRRLVARIYRMNRKQKRRSSLDAVEKVYAYIRSGQSVGIFPEGDRCWDGATAAIPRSAAKLVKLLGVPAVMARISGAYLTSPRWTTRRRRGQICIEFSVLSATSVSSMGVDALHESIAAALDNSDIKDPRLNTVRFRGNRLAEGIQFLLWFCPLCQCNDTMSGVGNTIVCGACGGRWSLDGNCRVEPSDRGVADLKDWCDLQRAHLAGRVATAGSDEEIARAPRVELWRTGASGAGHCGAGELRLTPRVMRFEPPGARRPLEFKTQKIKHFADNFNAFVRFDYGNDSYRAVMHGANALKWCTLFECLESATGS